MRQNTGDGTARQTGLRCSQIVIPGRDIETVQDVNIYGPVREIAQGVVYGDLNATFHLSQDLKERKFDVLLNMHASMSANLISTMIPSKRKVGFDKARSRDKQSLFCNEYIPAKTEQHVADGLIEFVNHLTQNDGHPTWSQLSIDPEENEIKQYTSTLSIDLPHKPGI